MRGHAVAALLLAASVTGVAVLQGRAARHCGDVKAQTDVYVLPPPEQLAIMSLGYRSALADLMWADVLVTQGFRLQEKRHYDTLVPQLEGITYLDPTFREPYLVGDALVTFQATEATVEDARATRRLLETGVKNLPLDGELWSNLGSFVAFLAPSSILTDPEEIAAWQRDGAAYLERSIELSGDNSSFVSRALGGGGNFGRLGYRDAAMRFYRKVISITSDEEIRAKAEEKLRQVENAATGDDEMKARVEKERLEIQRTKYLEWQEKQLRRRWFPALTLNGMRVVGPPAPPALCAGGRSTDEICATEWPAWVERTLAAPTAP